MKDYATFITEVRAAHVADGFDADQLEPHLAEWYEAYRLDYIEREDRANESARKAHREANPGCAEDGQECDGTCEPGYRDFPDQQPNPGCLAHRRFVTWQRAAHQQAFNDAQAAGTDFFPF